MTDVAADKIASRLVEAAQTIERSLRRTRQSAGNAASGKSSQPGSAIEQEWAALKKDLADLITGTNLAETAQVKAVREQIRNTMRSFGGPVTTATDQAQHRARGSADRINEYAHTSPWQAAGIAAAAGFVIGVLLSRK